MAKSQGNRLVNNRPNTKRLMRRFARVSRNDVADAGTLERITADAAYCRAQERDFIGGDPLADWLVADWPVAETQINKLPSKGD